MNFAPLKEKFEKLDRELPRQTTGLLPSEAFFCRSLAIPEGTSPADIGGLAQLQLEANAPFPVENLSWGYLARNGRLLLFAAMTDRAAKGIKGGLESLLYALPAFLPFALESNLQSVATSRLCVAGRSASLLKYNAGDSLPSSIRSCALPAEVDSADTAAVLAARPKLLNALGAAGDDTVENGVRILLGTNESREGRLDFKVALLTDAATTPEAISYSLSGAELWNADARGRAFAAQESERRRKDRYVWLAFTGAGAVAAIIVLLLLVLAAMSVMTGFYKARADKRMEVVSVLQDKADFATNLESVTDREMKPFSMIAAAAACKPEGLFFENVSSKDWNAIDIEGKAQRSDIVQDYIESLSRSPYVSEASNLKTTTSRGSSSYAIEVVFNPLDDLTDDKK